MVAQVEFQGRERAWTAGYVLKKPPAGTKAELEVHPARRRDGHERRVQEPRRKGAERLNTGLRLICGEEFCAGVVRG